MKFMIIRNIYQEVEKRSNVFEAQKKQKNLINNQIIERGQREKNKHAINILSKTT